MENRIFERIFIEKLVDDKFPSLRNHFDIICGIRERNKKEIYWQ